MTRWRLTALLALIVHANCLRYKGCYINPPAPNNIQNMPLLYGKQLSQTLVPQLCHNHCLKCNMPWAALQGGDRCWCSNALPPEMKVDDIECDHKCAGDETQSCGGSQRLSVYEVNEITNEIGCFKDFENRTMPFNKMFQELGMNPDLCVGHCRNRKANFAGVEAGTECWCSTKQPPEFVRAENPEECNYECSGDASRVCGGAWRLSVFKVDDRAKFVGCYETESIALPTVSETILSSPGTLTPSNCIAHCRELLKSFAGVTGQDCWCLEKLPSFTQLANETDCHLPCSGDQTKICGGDSRISVYELLDIAPYIGCYKDGGTVSTRQMPLDIAYWHEDLTPEICIIHCRNRRRSFAGLQNRKQCFCSEKLSLSRAPEVQCSDDCTGDVGRKCGGPWRLSVYNLKVREDISEFYMGCYKETNDANSRWEARWNFPKHLTPELCMGHCWRNNYEYAAVRDGDECRCANDIIVTTRVSETECSFTCPGDRNSKCGHLFRTNVYRTGNEGMQKNKTNENYLGCYLQSEQEDTLSRTMLQTLTDKNCIQFCLKQRYKLAGLQNGNVCTCLNTMKSSNKLDEGRCSVPCSGDRLGKCGAKESLSIYKTGMEASVASLSLSRTPSLTTVNGEKTYSGKIIFMEDFKTNTDLSQWIQHKYMPTDPDHEFVMFTDNPENCFIRNGMLHIKPTVLDDSIVRGSISLDGCTGQVGTLECEREAFAFRINPPIESARLTTKLKFQYGQIDIVAKLPLGDWIWPELRLVPADSNRTDYVKMAMVRGNARLYVNHADFGNTVLEAGIASSTPTGVRQKILNWTQQGRPWSADPHTYTTIWSPTKITFLVDNKRVQGLYFDTPEFQEDDENFVDASFLKDELHLSVGVSVGGATEFSDETTGDTKKPWRNGLKGMTQFFKAKSLWYKTWKEEESALHIYSISIKAL